MNVALLIVVLIAVADLFLASWTLAGCTDETFPATLTPMIYNILSGILMLLYGLAWLVSWGWAALRGGMSRVSTVRHYILHYFACFFAALFPTIIGIVLLAKNDALWDFPEFLLETDALHATLDDVIAEDIYFILFRALLVIQLGVSIRNIISAVDIFKTEKVLDIVSMPYTKKMGPVSKKQTGNLWS